MGGEGISFEETGIGNCFGCSSFFLITSFSQQPTWSQWSLWCSSLSFPLRDVILIYFVIVLLLWSPVGMLIVCLEIIFTLIGVWLSDCDNLFIVVIVLLPWGPNGSSPLGYRRICSPGDNNALILIKHGFFNFFQSLILLFQGLYHCSLRPKCLRPIACIITRCLSLSLFLI